MKIEEKAEKLLDTIVEAENKKEEEDGKIHTYEIVDVEYVKEGSDYYLRAYVDKDSGITIKDCERISRSFEELLDQEDLIKDAYILEVSSPGLTRALKKDRDFERNLNKPIEIHLFQPMEFAAKEEPGRRKQAKMEKRKILIGELKSYSDETLTIDIGKNQPEILSVDRKNAASVKQYFEW